jgi:hypothetical protein
VARMAGAVSPVTDRLGAKRRRRRRHFPA